MAGKKKWGTQTRIYHTPGALDHYHLVVPGNMIMITMMNSGEYHFLRQAILAGAMP